jgi:hypothetical protein
MPARSSTSAVHLGGGAVCRFRDDAQIHHAGLGLMATRSQPIMLFMNNNMVALSALFLLAALFSLYIMRRRSRLGKRTPKF